MDVSVLHYFSLRPSFVPLSFNDKVFNKTVITNLKGECYKEMCE